jgi:thiamine-phosphate pyrophosphorylase
MTFPAGVHLITDRRRCGAGRLVPAVEKAVAGGVAAVHLREPDLSAAELFELAVSLREVTAKRCAFVVNDRLDVALAVGADGVQLGRRSLPTRAARQVAGGLRIGRSVHGVEEAVAAEQDGADYVIVGTIFATGSHPGVPPAGTDLVRRVREAVGIPILGIGGVTAANAGEVIRAGAEGVAVIGAILDAEDVEAATRRLVSAVEEARRGR